MSLVIPPGFAQAAYLFQLGGDAENMITTVGVDISERGGSAVAAALSLSSDFLAAYDDSEISNEWVYKGIILRVGQDGDVPFIHELPVTLQGTMTGANLPNNCAMLVRKSTARGGRSGRGRMFVPPFALEEDQVDGRGTLQAGFLIAQQAKIDIWFGGDGFVLLHDSTAPGSLDPTPITNFVVDQRIATQRRRMRP